MIRPRHFPGERHRQAALLLLAVDSGTRLRTLLEFTVVVSIVMILVAVAVSNFETHVTHGQTAEAFFLGSTLKADLVEYRAVNGRWPAAEGDLASAALEKREDAGAYVTRVDLLENGAFSVHFNDHAGAVAGRRLTFRPDARSARSGSPIAWHCGGQGSPAAVSDASGDGADTGGDFLPFVCRQR